MSGETPADAANRRYAERIKDFTMTEIGKLPDECRASKDRRRYICYVLRSTVAPRRTYCGCSNDLPHRLKQHNGVISGGARATSSTRPWRIACVITGFTSKSTALRYEFFTKVKHSRKTYEDAQKRGLDSIQRRVALLRAAEGRVDDALTYHALDERVKQYLNAAKPPPRQTRVDSYMQTH